MSAGSFQRLGRWIDNHRETIALVISAVGLVFLTDFLGWARDSALSWLWRIGGGIGLSVTIVSAWFGARGPALLATENEALRQQVSEMEAVVLGFGSDYFDIWDKRLQVLAEELNLDARDRISVYRHENNAFTMVGRHALLPEYDKPGRSVYPVDQGVIGSAWKTGDGKCVIQDFPDPNSDFDGYCEANQRDWSVSKKVTQKMSMRARSIAAFALNDERNSSRHAIIVFESTAANRFAVEELEARVRGSAGKELVHLLEIIRTREPSLEFAKGKGF